MRGQDGLDEDDSWRGAVNLDGAVSRMGFYGAGGGKLWMVSQVCSAAPPSFYWTRLPLLSAFQLH